MQIDVTSCAMALTYFWDPFDPANRNKTDRRNNLTSWGPENCGGGKTLSGVQKVFPGKEAYAAIMDDGKLITWGNPKSAKESFLPKMASLSSCCLCACVCVCLCC
mmetsp:Transcript_36676/g.67744  ORF Transcript_36676/g.67744 Transcript_36676/m.67744 type:complete len:105 (+) Transcript_36676:803-1117(+)